MWTLWISPFIKACFSSLNTEGGFKYYILCSVLTSLRNNPVRCFYAIHKILDGKRNLVLLVEYASLRYVDCFFPSGGDFTPVGFLAEVRLQDDCRSISLEGLKEISIETPR